MCGICGSIGYADGEDLVQKMTRAMLHRGPDSEGCLNSGFINLGMRRLKIIDLKTGDQPVFNDDSSIAVVMNGEIYNFRELRQELLALGHKFTTQSDTEVVVHAYEVWGMEFLARVNGMFALALLDRRQVERPHLVLARDRLGIKPLYLYKAANRLLFASEVRALLSSGEVPPKPSLAGIYSYLAFGSVQEPLTAIQGVVSLSPGAWLQVHLDVERGSVNLEVNDGIYWRPPAPDADIALDGQADIPQIIRHELFTSVASHLVSDVPLGAFLSGGLDSSAIVALASQSLREGLQPDKAEQIRLRTFTLGFANWPLDERSLAEATARRWHTQQQSLEISQSQLVADLPDALHAMDQPTIDGINSWYISRAAREAGLTVALSGVGGDELFAGYPSFRQAPRLERTSPWLGRLAVRGFGRWMGSPDSRRKTNAYFDGDSLYPHPYFAVRGLFTSSQIQNLLRKEILEQILSSRELAEWQKVVADTLEVARKYDAVGKVSWLELSHYMRSTLLRDTDMMSMAHSLEVRVPFVDHRLVESVLPVSDRWKVDGSNIKPLLSQALQDDLPVQVLRGAKRTFTFPFETWLRQGLGEQVGARLAAPSALGGWFQPDGVKQTWQEFENGQLGWARPWSLYVLDQWLEKIL